MRCVFFGNGGRGGSVEQIFGRQTGEFGAGGSLSSLLLETALKDPSPCAAHEGKKKSARDLAEYKSQAHRLVTS